MRLGEAIVSCLLAAAGLGILWGVQSLILVDPVGASRTNEHKLMRTKDLDLIAHGGSNIETHCTRNYPFEV